MFRSTTVLGQPVPGRRIAQPFLSARCPGMDFAPLRCKARPGSDARFIRFAQRCARRGCSLGSSHATARADANAARGYRLSPMKAFIASVAGVAVTPRRPPGVLSKQVPRTWPLSVSELSKGTPGGSSHSGIDTTLATGSDVTTPKPCAGTAWPPRKGTPGGSSSSGTCTPTAAASRRSGSRPATHSPGRHRAGCPT